MKRMMLFAFVFAAVLGTRLHAQDVTGTWQGTLKAEKDLRQILVVTRDDGKLKASMYSIDQGAMSLKASSVSQDGSTFKFAIDFIGGSYEAS